MPNTAVAESSPIMSYLTTLNGAWDKVMMDTLNVWRIFETDEFIGSIKPWCYLLVWDNQVPWVYNVRLTNLEITTKSSSHVRRLGHHIRALDHLIRGFFQFISSSENPSHLSLIQELFLFIYLLRGAHSFIIITEKSSHLSTHLRTHPIYLSSSNSSHSFICYVKHTHSSSSSPKSRPIYQLTWESIPFIYYPRILFLFILFASRSILIYHHNREH